MAPRFAAFVVVGDFTLYGAFVFLQIVEFDGRPPAVLGSLVLLVATLALQLAISRSLRHPLGPGLLTAAVAAQAVLAFGPIALFGQFWIGTVAYVAGSMLIVFRRVVRWVAFVLVLAAGGAAQALLTGSVLDVAYTVVATGVFGLSVYGLTALAALSAGLYAARAEASRLAVEQERTRFATEVRDLVGLSLASTSSRADLLRTALRTGPERARAGLRDAQRVIQRALTDTRSTTRGRRELRIEAEARSAERKLAAAGMSAVVRIEVGELDGAVASVAAGALRDGVRDVVDRATATSCAISATRRVRDVVVEMSDDGGPREGGQAPLDDLALRLKAVGGSLRVRPAPGHGTSVRATVPLRLVPADRQAAPVLLGVAPPRGLVSLVLVAITAASVLHLLYLSNTPGRNAFAVLFLLLALGVQLLLSNGAPSVRAPASGPWLLLALIVLAFAPITALGDGWVGATAFAAGSALLVLPRYWGWVVFATVVLAAGAVPLVQSGSLSEVRFSVAAAATTGVVVFALTLLADLVQELGEAIETRTARSVAAERQRMARDLHDVLGADLSAILLKLELAERLAVPNTDRAVEELDDVLRLCRRAMQQVTELTASSPDLDLDAESRRVESMLLTLGASVDMDLAFGELPSDVCTALALTLRVGVANVVRHSRAERCEILIRQEGRSVSLDIVNDGVVPEREREPSPPGVGGQGIGNLSSRIGALGGEVHTDNDVGGRFRLRVVVPV